MEPGADLEKACYPSPELDPSPGRWGDPRKNLQERALARAVFSNHSQHFAGTDFEIQVLERPERLVLGRRFGSERSEPAKRRGHELGEGLTYVSRPRRGATHAIAFGEVFDADRDRAHDSDKVCEGAIHPTKLPEASNEQDGAGRECYAER